MQGTLKKCEIFIGAEGRGLGRDWWRVRGGCGWDGVRGGGGDGVGGMVCGVGLCGGKRERKLRMRGGVWGKQRSVGMAVCGVA